MINFRNFLLSSGFTYMGVLCTDVSLSPEIIELLKLIISGIFGLLSTLLINWIARKTGKTKKEIQKILKENEVKKFSKNS